MIGGERDKLQVAHIKLSHSRAFIAARLSAADPRDAVRRPQPRLRGLGRRAAARHLRQHEDRGRSDRPRQGAEVNARFAAMASHYLFEPEFCNPASGWEKGQVEKNVQDARRRLWQRCPAFPTSARSMPGSRSAASRTVARDRRIASSPAAIADVHGRGAQPV